MVLKGLILLVLSLLSGVIVFVATLWAIIRWQNKKSRTTGCLIAILFLLFSLICGGYLAYKSINTVIEKAPKIKAQGINLFSNLMGSYHECPFMDSLRQLQMENILIPKEYFTYAGFRDYYRMPLIYPYSMNAIDLPDYGFICNEEEIKYIAKDVNKSKQVIHSIFSFSFNKDVLIAQTETSTYNFKYQLLHFKTGEIEEFENDSIMKIKAYQYGIDTIKPMITVNEYYNKFFKAD